MGGGNASSHLAQETARDNGVDPPLLLFPPVQLLSDLVNYQMKLSFLGVDAIALGKLGKVRLEVKSPTNMEMI